MMKRTRWLALAAAALLTLPVRAQAPGNGGELVFPVPSEPPSYDGHREETFGLIHPIAPFYHTLLRVDPNDKGGTKPHPSIPEARKDPARGAGCARKGQYAVVEKIGAPNDAAVVLRVTELLGAFIAWLLSPYNFI